MTLPSDAPDPSPPLWAVAALAAPMPKHGKVLTGRPRNRSNGACPHPWILSRVNASATQIMSIAVRGAVARERCVIVHGVTNRVANGLEVEGSVVAIAFLGQQLSQLLDEVPVVEVLD